MPQRGLARSILVTTACGSSCLPRVQCAMNVTKCVYYNVSVEELDLTISDPLSSGEEGRLRTTWVSVFWAYTSTSYIYRRTDPVYIHLGHTCNLPMTEWYKPGIREGAHFNACHISIQQPSFYWQEPNLDDPADELPDLEEPAELPRVEEGRRRPRLRISPLQRRHPVQACSSDVDRWLVQSVSPTYRCNRPTYHCTVLFIVYPQQWPCREPGDDAWSLPGLHQPARWQWRWRRVTAPSSHCSQSGGFGNCNNAVSGSAIHFCMFY